MGELLKIRDNEDEVNAAMGDNSMGVKQIGGNFKAYGNLTWGILQNKNMGKI